MRLLSKHRWLSRALVASLIAMLALGRQTIAIGGNEGLGKFRIYGHEGDFSDIDPRVWWVAYDFDTDDASGKLMAVTITYPRAGGTAPSQVFRDRTAAVSVIEDVAADTVQELYRLSRP